MSVIGPSLVLCLVLAADGAPAPKLPPGKDTTYVTGPLDKDGYIDYEAALNDRLGKGVTPETNANVLIWKALGPTPEGGQGSPPAVFKRLGIDEPPKDGAYFISLGAFMRDHLKLDPSEFEALAEEQALAGKRPWAAKDHPHIAAWLEANEKPMALVVEATRRPDYYNPLISRHGENEPGSLISALLPSVQKCRELATALTDRAMLRVGEGKFDDAWQDLLACHRLGRLVARGGTLIEALVGFAIDNIASNADLAYLERADLTAAQARDRMKDLQALPPMPPLADKIDLCERFVYLDSVGLARRGGMGTLEGLRTGRSPPKTRRGRGKGPGCHRLDAGPARRQRLVRPDRRRHAPQGPTRTGEGTRPDRPRPEGPQGGNQPAVERRSDHSGKGSARNEGRQIDRERPHHPAGFCGWQGAERL